MPFPEERHAKVLPLAQQVCHIAEKSAADDQTAGVRRQNSSSGKAAGN